MSRLGRVADTLVWLSGVAAATAVVLLFTLDGSPDPPPAASTGSEIYAARCAVCHGAEGEGGTGPRLADAPSVVADDPAAAVATVTVGRNTMPGFGGDLTAAEIDAVVAFVRDRP